MNGFEAVQSSKCKDHAIDNTSIITQTEVECTSSVPAVPCSVHCRYTSAYAVYMQYRLLIHC